MRWSDTRPRKVVALQEQQVTIELPQAAILLGSLDTFGNQLASQAAGDIENRAQELTLAGVAIDTGDKMTIKLNEIGTQLGPVAQTRMSRPQVIQSDLKPDGLIMRHRLAHQRIIMNRDMFSKLDHHPVRGQAKLLQITQRQAFAVVALDNSGRHDIEKQAPRQTQSHKGGNRQAPAHQVQLYQQACLHCHIEQLERRVQRRAFRAANQRLVTMNALPGHIDNRLKAGRQPLPFNDRLKLRRLSKSHCLPLVFIRARLQHSRDSRMTAKGWGRAYGLLRRLDGISNLRGGHRQAQASPMPSAGSVALPARTFSSMRRPVSASMFFQYSRARSSTGLRTPPSKLPATCSTSLARCSSSNTSRTMVPGWPKSSSSARKA